ncbi:hypothetical protein M3175_21590 [Robertmurraya korlensis]|uniref:hypothetical protein n=1 Tax=Robertmurraya korlensis TaxID=519977 RepID=UPI00203D6748|nr:hypothetical protein [Robertmurraya korlensis]MCM3603316.1 hypothetical protein [Robertmurraya korlensis]
MHKAVEGGGGGSSKLININPDEMTTIFKYLDKILNELESNAAPNIEKLGNLNYYTEGKAKKTMEVYAEANQKVMDLYDNYTRASTLVVDILNTMMEADAAIAEQIIAKLGV